MLSVTALQDLFKKTIKLYIYKNVMLRELSGRGHFETVLISHWKKNPSINDLCIDISLKAKIYGLYF